MERRVTSYHSQGLSRALEALKTLGRSSTPLSLADLSRAMDLPKPTLMRILAVMEDEDFVRKEGNPPLYTIGHSILEIADAYKPVDIGQVAGPTMQILAAELGFTTNLGVLEDRSVLHLHVEEPQRALRFASSGTLDFTYCTGLGKLLLSLLPVGEVSEHLPATEPYERFTDKTIVSREAFDSELERVRKQGYSLDDEERNRGVTCMAVLIPTDLPFAASLSVSAPTGELQPADQLRILPSLRRAAAELGNNDHFTAALATLGK